MAEFKLGRIRFVWQGAWVTGTTYYKDDVVRFGGKVYLCQIGHAASADFNTDLDIVPSKWSLMNDGQRWTGDWTTSHAYEEGDLVKYGGTIYVCTNGHTSAATTALGLENNEPADWDTFVEGFDWKGDWTTSTRYKFNDIVRYGGINYVCITGHTSASTASSGLETDSGKWQVFSQGQEYKGAWTTTTRYKLNDVVKWGAGLWICTTQHTSSDFNTNIANWAQYTEGFEFESTWSNAVEYQPGDIVSYGGNRYIAKAVSTAANPVTETSSWDLYSEGLSYQSTWANTTSYKIGHVVQYNGYNYLATADSPSLSFTVTAATASNDRFTIADTTGIVAGMSVRFTGTTFGDVFTGARYYVKTVAAGYITISDSPSGTTYNVASDASGSMTATISAEPPHASYWTNISRGFYWRGAWTDDTEYNAGDVVRHNANAYICVLAHRGEGDDGSTVRAAGGGQANSRPDLDVSGTYWNTLTVGSETSVLTTTGDMVYYGGAGPTRLPVGTEGQVLRVSSGGIPEWVTWGKVDHVYYVAPHGENRPYPDCGASLDKPWASIRYACQQVEKGCRNPQAAHLLELNRVFVQREVTAWIRHQISIATLGGTWYNFDYDEHKCERDVGFIVDRIIWDITHGGNLKTLSAALTYINALGNGDLFATAADENGTGTYTKLSSEGAKDVLAFNYMKTVMNAVLANEAPSVVYQNVTNDSSAIVDQYINTAYVAEDGVVADVATLVGIVTTALADGVATNLPSRLVPSNTINVKTGNYTETLPIIVPAETALVGDEVRSVHVRPRTADNSTLTPRADSFYTVSSMDRLASVVSSIVQGTSVTASTGNTETQTTEWPVSTSSVADLATSKIRALKYNIDFRLGTINSFSYPDPTDYNTVYLTGYGDARTLILANKEFFKAQVEAYIDANYPDVYYSRTSCKRDVGYITDAMVYDLTYGGNAMTVQAGLAYYQGVGSTLFIDSTERTATLAAYNYLKDMFQKAASNTTITVLQTGIVQTKNLLLTGGSAASTFIGNCLTELVDIVTNGPSAETLTDPSTSWVASAYTTDYSAMNSAVSTIQTGTIDYINSNFGSFTYNSALCRRDAGYLVDAAYYDAAFGSNFWAVQNGLSYLRTQAAVVSAAQLEQEIGAIGYIKTQVAAALAGDSTAVSRSNAAYVEILDIINNGVAGADALVYTDTGTANFTNARAQLVTNRAFIISEMVTWMTANVPGYVALSADGKTLCQRDLGYAIDALAYDVNYGGNTATRNFCRSLFNNITGTGVESVNSGTTYTQLGVVCAQIVQETYAGQDTSGTAASSTEGTRMTTLCGNISTVATEGNLTNLVAESLPSVAWAVSAGRSTLSALASAKTTIVAGTLQYITDTYSDFSYNHSKCSRDVATIIKAVGYDMMFNANFQSLKAGYSYLRATATEVFDLNQKSVSRAALTYVRDQLLAVTSNATAEARITALFLAIDDIIYSGSNEGNVCQSEDRMVDYAALQLVRNKDFIVQELDAWMNYNYVNFDDYYNSATCSRDIGYIIDAVISDLATGSNFASSVAGESYYRIQAALVPGAQMMQTVAAVKEAKRLVQGYVTGTSQMTAVNAAFDNVVAILSGGLTAVPTYTWPGNGTSTGTTESDAAALQTNRATMVTGIETYLSTTAPYSTVWSGLTTAQKNACKRDVGYIIDAVSYDVQYGGNMQSTIAGSAYYSFGTLEIAAGEKAATLAALTQLGTLMKAYTSAGGDTTVDTLITLISGIVNTGATEPMTYTMPDVSNEAADTITTYDDIVAGVATIKLSVTDYITTTFSTYTYNTALCNRDTAEIVDALIWDLKYSSNYKTLLCGRWYANAVIGSEEEDMFYFRNGTGLRNATLEGLNGDLTPENAYGTRRVTAGAYASLDPGWGPDDFRTWIMTRSPYVQNCCTFGNAAIGQKIDGALHNGGNKSIVSNDFTQIISDGIGAWVTNDARAELVSVFTYYSHIGYLSEAGGRIRGTNGNNSYGDFGSVAEGYDVNETPIYCQVDNKAYDVTVGSVLTDGINYPWQFEYDNAGTDYTQAVWTISGGGSLAEVEQSDFRDGAVYQVRLLDNTDDSVLAPEVSGNYGGYGYISNANTAQSGTTTALTLAAVDDEISSAYVGMKLLITGGTGAGQVGIIDTYTAGTKVATVTKESTGGAGWDHVVPGTPIVAPDASSTYIVEPAVSFSAPTYSSTARTLGTAQSYTEAAYAPTFGVYTPVSATNGSGSGATFTVVRKGVKYSSVELVSAGTNYARLDVLTIAGTSLGGASTTNDITITVTSVSSTTGAIQAFEFTGFGCGGNFAAIASGSRNVNTSTNGTSWSENTTALPSTSTWAALASGALTVVESAGSFVTGRAYVITSLGNTVFTSIGSSANIVGTYFVATGAGSGSGTATPVASHLVAVSGSTTVNAYSTDAGVTWTSGGALPVAMSGAAVDVAYGRNDGVGTWIAIASNGKTATSTNGGVSWSAGGDLPAGTWQAVAYGAGRWVAIATSGTASAYSTDGGSTWTAGGSLGTSTTWIDVVYGSNKFVAVSSDGAVSPVYTVNGGTNWYNTGVAGWLNETVTKVSYGQGVFVATNSTSNNMASSEDGINWTTRAITRASGTGALRAVHGNPHQIGIWAIIPSASTTAASSAVLGAKAKGRAYVSSNKIYAIRVTDPGSAYASAPTITITDPSNLYDAPTTVRIGNGACANPCWISRGSAYDSAIAELDSGDGYANNYQSGQFMAVSRLTGIPEAGANVVFSTQPNTVYKLVQVLSQTGEYDGGRGAFLQISPDMSVYNSPADGTAITTRIRYSQVRLTGHDFLDVGTGGFTTTNYPNEPTQSMNQLNETVDNNGGRVFYTSTDQDGNFRVGELFVIEQATGKATLNADAFNIAGLSELSLGNITLGGNSATITEFSTDPFLTANSDSVVPTQRAIKAYIAAQIGGGGASLNVNSIVAGFIEVAGTHISTTTGGTIQMKANFNFRAGVRGYPVAWNYFLNN